MGGYGSNRWRVHIKKTLVEESQALDITPWLSILAQRPRQHIFGTRTSTSGVTILHFEIDTTHLIGPHVRLRHADENYSHNLTLDQTQRRWWWLCCCGRRTGKLYRPPGEYIYACRTCHNLTYRSSQQSHTKAEQYYRELVLGVAADTNKPITFVHRVLKEFLR